MLSIKFELVSAGPILFGKMFTSEKATGEAHDAFEKRVWRERMWCNEDGYVFLPPNALKRTLENCAKYLSETIPGKGKSTYTKHFLAGLMVINDIVLKPYIKPEDVQGVWMAVPSDGMRGGTKRVMKCFPVITSWTAEAEVILTDPILIDKPEKVEEYINHAGKFVGLMSMRPQNGGSYGRYYAKNFKRSNVI